MGAVWIWVRSEWRRGWGGLLGIGLLISIAGGVTMAAAAGARRADSAIERFQVATNAPAAGVGPKTNDLRKLMRMLPHLPTGSDLADRLAAAEGVDGVSVIDFIGATPDPTSNFFNAALVAERGRAPKSLVIEGRRFDPSDPNEVVVNETAAHEWGSVGSVLTLHTIDPSQLVMMGDRGSDEPAGPKIDVRVVGVVRGIEEITDVPEPILVASPAFVDRYGDEVAIVPGEAQIASRAGQGAGLERLVADLGDAAGRQFVAFPPDEDFAGRVDEAVSVEVTAMWVFALAALAAGLVIVYQAISRWSLQFAGERATRRGLGFTRRGEIAGSVIRAIPAVVIGLGGSVALSVSASALFPRGIARRADPSPGVLADWPVLLIGAAAVVLGGLGLAAMTGWVMPDRAVDRPRRTRNPARVGGALRPDVAIGLRLAFSGSRRARVSEAGLIGAAVAVGGFVAVAAVESSANHLTSTPRLYGAGWNAVLELDDAPPDKLVQQLAADPEVNGVGALDALAADELDATGPGGPGPVEPQAVVARVGSITQTLTAGRLPAGPTEVAIGDTVSAQLGADVGDTVVVKGYRRQVPLVVVGRVLNAGTNELGNGFDVTSEGLRAITDGCPKKSEDDRCQIVTQGVGVSFHRGVDAATAIAHLRRIDDGFIATPLPSVVYNLRQIGAAPWYLATFLTVLGVSALAHALATGRRLGRQELAVTRALGLSPGQSAAALMWQALALAVVGAALGVLLGPLAGRLVWHRVAQGTGALVQTVVPVWAWFVAPAALVIVALALAAVPALRIAGERPGPILRTE